MSEASSFISLVPEIILIVVDCSLGLVVPIALVGLTSLILDACRWNTLLLNRFSRSLLLRWSHWYSSVYVTCNSRVVKVRPVVVSRLQVLTWLVALLMKKVVMFRKTIMQELLS